MTKILHIEDQPEFRRDLCFLLNEEGFETIEARDGEEGLRMLSESSPDIVICDVNMPKVSGFDLLQNMRLQSRRPGTPTPPFIFLTGMGDENHVITGANLLADDFLVKPVPFHVLLAKINSALGRSKLYENNVQYTAVKHLIEDTEIILSNLIEEVTAAVIMQKDNMFKQVVVSFEADLPPIRANQELLLHALREILNCIVNATDKKNKTYLHTSYDYGDNGIDITIAGRDYSRDFLRGITSLPAAQAGLTPQGIRLVIIDKEGKLAIQIKIPESLVG